MASMHGECIGAYVSNDTTDSSGSPGRFFAVNEIKCMMGYLLMNYDVKWPNRDFMEGGYIPPLKFYGVAASLDENAKIMIRRRIRA